MHPDLKLDKETYFPLYPSTIRQQSGWISRQNIKCSIFFISGLVIGCVVGAFSMSSKGTAALPLPQCIQSSDIGGKTTKTIITAKLKPTETKPSFTQAPSSKENSCAPCADVQECVLCPMRNPVIVGDSRSRSVFAPLSVEEVKKTIRALSIKSGSQRQGLQITHIYHHTPDKTQALQYLDSGGPFPGRYAKVHVTRSGRLHPDVMEYKVGPLDGLFDDIKVQPLLRDGEIHYNRRPYDSTEEETLRDTVAPHLTALKQLLIESFDGRYVGKGLDMMFSTYPTADGNDRVSSMFLHYIDETKEETITVLPVQCLLHHPGVNTSLWFASDFYYLNQGPYHTGQDLYEAYRTNRIRRWSLPKGYLDEHWSDFFPRRNSSEPKRQHSDIPPPRTYEPEGPRYSIEDSKVTWMGWSFHFTANPIRGPTLFDIRFKGKRIAYEISLQDITLLYSSGTTGAGTTPPILSDTEFLLGQARDVRKGLDCPDRATILNTTAKDGRDMPLACLFEADGQSTLWRHVQEGYARGLLNHFLVLRCPLTFGNYDYTLQWSFHLDGHLETTMTASGYLFTSFWDAFQNAYRNLSTAQFGFKVGNLVMGSIHEHSFVFKIDLDILGRNNSFELIRVKSGDFETIWKSGVTKGEFQKKPPFIPFEFSRYLANETVLHEKGFKADPSVPEIWTAVNDKETNRWGNKRGYRLVLITSPAVGLSESHPFSSAWSHMKYHCAVTKYHPRELYASQSIYDLNNPYNSVGGIDKMLNGEAIQNEDIVAWVTAAFLHVPTSEDFPMTMGVGRGFVLKPFNFFDSSPTFDLKAHYTREEPFPKKACYENYGHL